MPGTLRRALKSLIGDNSPPAYGPYHNGKQHPADVMIEAGRQKDAKYSYMYGHLYEKKARKKARKLYG